MSKVNIAKIVKDVGICSENLISISESLISISEKVSTVARVIAEIISEFQGEPDKPVIEAKAKKAAPKQIEAKTEEAAASAKEYTFTEVRTFLADKSRAGHTAEVRTLLQKYGAEKLSAVDPANYEALMKDAEVIGNGS